MPTITIKVKHVRKLKELGVYDRWLENVKKNMSLNGVASLLISKQSFELCISSSFVWLNTPEGHKFWEDIAEK